MPDFSQNCACNFLSSRQTPPKQTETICTFRSLLFHVNGRGTRCSSFSRIFSTFPETTFLAGHAGGHPSGCPHRAGLILSKKKRKKKRKNKLKRLRNFAKSGRKRRDRSWRVLPGSGSHCAGLISSKKKKRGDREPKFGIASFLPASSKSSPQLDCSRFHRPRPHPGWRVISYDQLNR